MALTSGKKRSSLRVKAAAKPTRTPLPLSQPISKTSASTSLFPGSKKDKQEIKHSSFVSRIEKSSKTQKRRRPNKQLVANFDSLADALPGLGEENGDSSGNGEVVLRQAKIQRKSLKSRPGAMKKKEKLEKLERERFNANLVQMAGSSAGAGAIVDRWAALKNHIKITAEQKSEFAKK